MYLKYYWGTTKVFQIKATVIVLLLLYVYKDILSCMNFKKHVRIISHKDRNQVKI